MIPNFQPIRSLGGHPGKVTKNKFGRVLSHPSLVQWFLINLIFTAKSLKYKVQGWSIKQGADVEGKEDKKRHPLTLLGQDKNMCFN